MASSMAQRSQDNDLKVVTKKLQDTLGATVRIDPLKNELCQEKGNVILPLLTADTYYGQGEQEKMGWISLSRKMWKNYLLIDDFDKLLFYNSNVDVLTGVFICSLFILYYNSSKNRNITNIIIEMTILKINTCS